MAKGISFYFAMNVQTRTITISIIMPARTPRRAIDAFLGAGLLYIPPFYCVLSENDNKVTVKLLAFSASNTP